MKVVSAEDQAARKKWVKRQAVEHTYGGDDEGEDDDEDIANADGIQETSCKSSEATEPDCEITVISGKTCKCGQTNHRRTSHSKCPLNKKNK